MLDTGIGRVQTLLAHADKTAHEWGANHTIQLGNGAHGRGWSFQPTPIWGHGTGTGQIWGATNASRLAASDAPCTESRVAIESGYGVAGPGGSWSRSRRLPASPRPQTALGRPGAASAGTFRPGATIILKGARELAGGNDGTGHALLLQAELPF